MKKFRLLVLALMLVGSGTMFNESASAECGGDSMVVEGCTGSDRPNGCKCCSNNHCASNWCDINTDKCGVHP